MWRMCVMCFWSSKINNSLISTKNLVNHERCECDRLTTSNIDVRKRWGERRFSILFLRRSELNWYVGRSYSNQSYRDETEIIFWGMYRMRVCEDDFLFEFFRNDFEKLGEATFFTISYDWFTPPPHREKKKEDAKTVRLMTRNEAWVEKDIEENLVDFEFQIHGV